MVNPKFTVKRNRFEEITKNFQQKKIMIVGDVGVDRYTIGAASRLSPEAPVPVVAVHSVRNKLGMAANVADNIKSLGATPYLISMIGEDRIGEEFHALLNEKNITGKYVFSHKSRRTSL